MPKIITIPTNAGLVSSNFTLTNTVGASVSPFTGTYRTQEYDYSYWSGDITVRPMKRSDVVEWQSFLANLEGTTNYFQFGDPDAFTPRGTYDHTHLLADVRVDSGSNVNSATLTFANTNSVVTSTSAIFDGLVFNDFITISGAVNSENNGTFKVTTFTSSTEIRVDAVLVNESSTASCRVRQNKKGARALSLKATTGKSGTIKQGDYLSVQDASGNIKQLVMATADATVTSGSPNLYSVAIQPKLRLSVADDSIIGFSSASNRGLFRLVENTVEWQANNVSLYRISFGFTEVI